MLTPVSEVSRVLAAVERGDPGAAASLLPLVYGELRTLAARRLAGEKTGQTLQATALVHEAYARPGGGAARGRSGGRGGGGPRARPRPLLRRRRGGHAPHPGRGRPPEEAGAARGRPP